MFVCTEITPDLIAGKGIKLGTEDTDFKQDNIRRKDRMRGIRGKSLEVRKRGRKHIDRSENEEHYISKMFTYEEKD